MASYDDLSRSLKYPPKGLRTLILELVKSRLSDLGGRNSYETLQYYKAEVTKIIANIFGGESIQSDFEKGVGITLRNPLLADFGLTAESAEIYNLRAKIARLSAGVRDLVDAGMKPKEASYAVQAVMQAATRSIETLQAPRGLVSYGGRAIVNANRRSQNN
jgi:hypothetical protein